MEWSGGVGKKTQMTDPLSLTWYLNLQSFWVQWLTTWISWRAQSVVVLSEEQQILLQLVASIIIIVVISSEVVNLSLLCTLRSLDNLSHNHVHIHLSAYLYVHIYTMAYSWYETALHVYFLCCYETCELDYNFCFMLLRIMYNYRRAYTMCALMFKMPWVSQQLIFIWPRAATISKDCYREKIIANHPSQL